MGYDIEIVGENFFIPKDKFNNCIKSGKNINDEDVEVGDVDPEELKNAKTIEDVFLAWGYDIDKDKEGNINYINTIWGKLENEIALFRAIAPYVKKGSYIDVAGEDYEIWRWLFDGKNVKEIKGKVSFKG